ncbi:hypothetical protein Taro_056033 [Colocasia esculenta]|uniref:Uncharacterized protein n=1 Tax=Colocasia esculenta TaxID=4460 RepID=A0A843XV07_COLES|nr:hypothetical protein [Colocasia esculenta]
MVVCVACGRPRVEHPVGLLLSWCRDRGVHRDTRTGVCLVGCDLITTRMPIVIRIAVATRFPVATGLCCDAPPRRYRVAVVVTFFIVMGWLALKTFWWGTRGSAWFLLCLPCLFARCLELEGLPHSEVVCVAWDPHPREPVEGVLQATSMLELEVELADSRAEGKMRQELSWRAEGVDGVSPSLLLAAVAWLPLFRWSGLVRTRAFGGFRSVSSRFRGPVLGCQFMVAPACVASQPCGVSGVWGGSVFRPSTLWRSEVAVLVVRLRSRLVVAWSRRVCRGLTPLLPSAGGSSSRELGVRRVAEVAMTPCLVSSSESKCCELLYLSELRVVLCKFSGSVGGDANFGVPGRGPGVVRLSTSDYVRTLGYLEGVTVEVQSHHLPARLFALQLHDFDAILGMDWLEALLRWWTVSGRPCGSSYLEHMCFASEVDQDFEISTGWQSRSGSEHNRQAVTFSTPRLKRLQGAEHIPSFPISPVFSFLRSWELTCGQSLLVDDVSAELGARRRWPCTREDPNMLALHFEVPCRLLAQIATVRVSPSGGDSLCVTFSDTEGT